MKQECISKLQELTNKEFIVFVKRGNAAIKQALEVAKFWGYSCSVLIQDQGGWITYSQFIKKLKLREVMLKTNYGLINPDDLKDYENSTLLINSMPGYFALQDMKKVGDVCKKKRILLVNDVSGSIGTDEAKHGDLIIGSFGLWKPLNAEEGGFIATDNDCYFKFLEEFEKELNFEKLYEKLLKLNERLTFLKEHVEKVKNDLSEYDIIHENHQGLNVVVKFSNDDEKEKLINYCKENNLESVECPKYIRVLDKAISIEIKRLG